MSKYASTIVVGICMLLVVLAPGTLPTVHAAQFEIRLAHPDPADIYTSRKAAGSTVFKAMVENETGGAVKVNLFPAGQLGEEREIAEAVKLGSVQVGMLSGPFSGFCKEAQVFDIPYLFPSLRFLFIKLFNFIFWQAAIRQCDSYLFLIHILVIEPIRDRLGNLYAVAAKLPGNRYH